MDYIEQTFNNSCALHASVGQFFQATYAVLKRIFNNIVYLIDLGAKPWWYHYSRWSIRLIFCPVIT